jgi:hypothetical protein
MARELLYKWRSRFLWALWVGGYFLFGVGVSAWTQIFETQPEVGEILLLWSVLFVLISITLILGRRIMIILSPIEISEDEIKGNFRSDKFEFWPKSNPGFLRWSDIKKFETFSYPDMDSLKMGKKSGVRLISKKNDKIVIYEHINGYGELLSMVRSRLESR